LLPPGESDVQEAGLSAEKRGTSVREASRLCQDGVRVLAPFGAVDQHPLFCSRSGERAQLSRIAFGSPLAASSRSRPDRTAIVAFQSRSTASHAVGADTDQIP